MKRLLCLMAVACLPVAAFAQDTPAAARDQDFALTPTGYVQFDMRAFPDWPISSGTGRLSHDTVEVRRIRAGLDGSWRRLAFEFSIDPLDDDGTLVKDAYAQLRVGSYRVRFGQMKLPGTREYGASARNTDFLERAGFVSSLGTHRDIGATVLARFGRRLDYQVGLFGGDDNGENDRAGLTAAGRLEWDVRKDLVVAGFASEGRATSHDTDPENGVSGRTPAGYRFFDDVYVQGRRQRLGGDVEWSPGDWQFTFEGLRLSDQRQEQGLDFEDLPAAIGTGASLTARWRFAARRDAAIRYEYLGFDDAGPGTGTDSVRPRATDIRPLAAHAVTLGGSWRVLPWARLVGNVGMEWLSDARSAPDPARQGTYFVLGTRLQIELP